MILENNHNHLSKALLFTKKVFRISIMEETYYEKR